MASFSPRRPFAYHVFPLQAARSILQRGALLSKAALGSDGTARRTTRDVDCALGFADFVHFYLPRAGAQFEELPILGAQLGQAKAPAAPHAVIEVDTSRLTDSDCTVCLWNIAVSRPGVEGVCKGGNWTRGTRPQRIAEVWNAFRASSPTVERARGFWRGQRVPVLTGDDVKTHGHLIKKRRKPVELLLRSPVVLHAVKVHVFSDVDAQSLKALCAETGVPLVHSNFEGYSGMPDPLSASVRTQLDAHLNDGTPSPSIDFDARR